MLDTMAPDMLSFVHDLIDMAKGHVACMSFPESVTDESKERHHLNLLALAWLTAHEIMAEEDFERASAKGAGEVLAKARALAKYRHGDSWRDVVFADLPHRLPGLVVNLSFGEGGRRYVAASSCMGTAEPVWRKYAAAFAAMMEAQKKVEDGAGAA